MGDLFSLLPVDLEIDIQSEVVGLFLLAGESQCFAMLRRSGSHT